MKQNHYKVIVIITERTSKKELLRQIDTIKHSFQFYTIARGTANDEMLDLLGLGSTEKVVFITIMDEAHVEELFVLLQEKLEFSKPGTGIAFTIPLESVCGKKAFELLTGDCWEVSI